MSRHPISLGIYKSHTPPEKKKKVYHGSKILADLEDSKIKFLFLNHLSLHDHLALITEAIEAWEDTNSFIDRHLLQLVLKYYFNNYLVGHSQMIYDQFGRIISIPAPMTGYWLHTLQNCEYKCFQDGLWRTIRDPNPYLTHIKNMIPDLEERQSSNGFLGVIMNDNKHGEMILKICKDGNLSKYKTAPFCIFTDLNFCCQQLDIFVNPTWTRNYVCSLIEQKLYQREQENDYKCYYNFFEYQQFRRSNGMSFINVIGLT